LERRENNKRIFQENILKEIEEFNSHNKTRRFYRVVNKMRKEFKPRISACQKKAGEMINKKEKSWKHGTNIFKSCLKENKRMMRQTIQKNQQRTSGQPRRNKSHYSR
jgi:hypothetical protein